MAKVNIFISSTCYDLSQIRDDLRQSIREIGHNPILSELKDFPIDPRLSTAENCISAIQKEADIFVLIIGNRYGAVLESGKSITNSEFLAALKKGIPIYTFALKNMTAILPLWASNPQADYSKIVDNNKVFEFLSDVRKNKGLWNFEFEKAQDIIEILKAQLSNLLHDALIAKRTIEQSDDLELYGRLSSKAINILVNKGPLYEIRFFMQSMKDEIEKYTDLQMDYYFSIMHKSLDSIENVQQFKKWASHKVKELHNITTSLDRLNSAVFKVWEEWDGPIEVKTWYYLSRTYARIYASLLEWGIDANSTIANKAYTGVMQSFASISQTIIEGIEKYPDESLKKIDDLCACGNEDEQINKEMKFTLNLNIDKDALNQFYGECQKVFTTVQK